MNPINYPTAFRAARDKAGMTQQALAAKAGISAGRVSDIERGARRPSRNEMERISVALGVKLSTLIRKAEKAAITD